MTIPHFVLAGALVLNVPTLLAASALPAGAVALSAVMLAIAGAALGAIAGWAIGGHTDAAVTTVQFDAAAGDRLAA